MDSGSMKTISSLELIDITSKVIHGKNYMSLTEQETKTVDGIIDKTINDNFGRRVTLKEWIGLVRGHGATPHRED